ncbi:hypothetical protein ANANG_G00115460 [Anguilla anguilla]|uniref:Dystrophin n=2 Tax=Anguilla anguilla TaxID=7936 RepID=A0A9D3MCL2_ANGAN|nr:hypothetical protein ANANG_G00115460 [Anguilla anguilla]
MQILEDHNKQLESQLHRLRQLLHQPEADSRINGVSSSSVLQQSLNEDVEPHPEFAAPSLAPRQQVM